MRPDKVIYFDTETTGLNSDIDEILSISIVDGAGGVLLNSLVKPVHNASWEEAGAVNGITPSMVEDAPTLKELQPQIDAIFQSCKRAVAYNAAFDMGFIKPLLSRPVDRKIDCAMVQFAVVYGEWNEDKQDWKWQSLGKAMEYYGLKWQGDWHNSLADTFACKAVYEAVFPNLYDL